MEYNKSKWEMKYEEFKNGSVDKEIEIIKATIKEQAQKFNQAIQDGKNSESQKAQDEINKLQGELKTKEDIKSAFTTNQSKIEHVLQLKKDLIKESAEVLSKKSAIQEYRKAKKIVEKNDKESKKIQLEIEALDAQIKQLNIKINDKNTLPADRARFEQDKAKLNAQRQQKSNKVSQLNSDEYINSRKTVDRLETEVGSYKVKDIDKTLAENEKLIAKCDLIGKSLVNGKSMNDITVSLKNFKFTPNKDFAKKVSAMRDVYEKEGKAKAEDATKAHEEAESNFETTVNAAKEAKEKLEAAMKEAKEAEEEYNKINNLPAPKPKWYENLPGAKIVKGLVAKLKREPTTKTAEEAKKEFENAKAEAEKAKKEFEEAERAAKEAQKERDGAETEARKATGERSTDYLAELRQQKDQDTVLEGMTLYGDTFKDRLKFQMPNTKTSLTQDEIDRAKSKNNYVIQNQNGKKDHVKDKRQYDVEARKENLIKTIAKMKGVTEDEVRAELDKKRKARQAGSER